MDVDGGNIWREEPPRNNNLGPLQKNDAAYLSEGHEYMLVWARNKAELDTKRGQLSKLDAWKQTLGKWRKKKEGADEILTAYAEAKSLYGTI